MNVRKSSNKRAVLEELLELGMVLVAFDARVDGVHVPDHLSRDPQLRLNLSYRFGRPLAVDDDAIEAELTFGGVPHLCRVPLPAIFLLVSHVNGEPFLFPDDVPPELLNQASGELRLRETPSEEKVPVEKKPRLSLVGTSEHGDEPAPPRASALETAEKKEPGARKKRPKKVETQVEQEAEETDTPPPSRTKRRPGHLRVVK